jgi:hypothetical protein
VVYLQPLFQHEFNRAVKLLVVLLVDREKQLGYSGHLLFVSKQSLEIRDDEAYGFFVLVFGQHYHQFLEHHRRTLVDYLAHDFQNKLLDFRPYLLVQHCEMFLVREKHIHGIGEQQRLVVIGLQIRYELFNVLASRLEKFELILFCIKIPLLASLSSRYLKNRSPK